MLGDQGYDMGFFHLKKKKIKKKRKGKKRKLYARFRIPSSTT